MAHIIFDNVSKTYSRQSRKFFLRYFLEVLGGQRKVDPFFALRDISFHLSAGESMAVVGHNGAGKSTLLNLVAGLTVPEEGRVNVNGRIMALLELGAGFHPDLTGHENLRINAALCGMTEWEVKAACGRIIEFSELGDFMNEPLRTYSQGMILRLAFSVAVNVDPDILLLDEVLAVGDKDFQKKCLSRIHELRDEGKILLCVSHIPHILHGLCEKALWIEKGQIQMFGSLAEVSEAYGVGD